MKVGNINLGLNNLLGNAFCQSNVGNGLAIAGIGDALAGDVGSDSGDGDCDASSISGDSSQDQDGGVNVGNLNPPSGAGSSLAALSGSSVAALAGCSPGSRPTSRS